MPNHLLLINKIYIGSSKKKPKWTTMREKEDARILPPCVKIKNRLTEVLTIVTEFSI
jgi:hypothetical protein